jgi:hypothetical protein
LKADFDILTKTSFNQILVGFEGDWIGRKWGMVQDALIMTLGTVLLVCSWGPSLQGWIWMYGWSLFIYGEHPIFIFIFATFPLESYGIK